MDNLKIYYFNNVSLFVFNTLFFIAKHAFNCDSVWNCQSIIDFWKIGVAIGISCKNDTWDPASINKTWWALFSAKREATIIPAVPPPTKILHKIVIYVFLMKF